MTNTGVALLGFALWSIVLLAMLAGFRTSLVLAGKKAANAFNPSGEDLEGFGRRLTRAHANCYENLPAAAAVMLFAVATDQTAITDPFAYAFLGARVLQSVAHLISTSRPFVLIRFGFFIVQIVILSWWILALFRAG